MTIPLACPLHHRGIVRISGDDRHAFLQGLISNDVALCTPRHPIYAALLTPQGKFLHDMVIADTGSEFLLDCESTRADDLVRRLTNYKLRAKVTIRNAIEEFGVWAIWGRDLFPMPGANIDPRLSELGMRAILPKDKKPEGARIIDFMTYDKYRLSLGVADGSRDMQIEKSTLLEGNFDLLNGISWTKGCYMGQELTARTHYRGLVKRRLFPVTVSAGEMPQPGSIICFDDQEVGEMRSSRDDIGLALLAVDKVKTVMSVSEPLLCEKARLWPSRPAWMKIDPSPSER